MKNITVPELLVDSRHGQFIPQMFAKIYGIPENFSNWDEIKEDVLFLQKDESNEDENYWDIWDTLLDTAKMIPECELYQHEDLWAMPIGFDYEGEGWN